MKNESKLYSIAKRIFGNLNLRLNLSLTVGVLMNIAYIFGNIASAFLYRSVWSATLTVYHIVLVIIRLYILTSPRDLLCDREIARVCFKVGFLLLLLDIASAAMMIYSVRRGIYVRYSGIVLLGFLVYTVYSVARSIFYMRKHAGEQRIHYAARNISLSTSLMSVFNLQYSVFSLLGANFRLTVAAILLCGTAVFTIILALSFRLIGRSLKELAG